MVASGGGGSGSSSASGRVDAATSDIISHLVAAFAAGLEAVWEDVEYLPLTFAMNDRAMAAGTELGLAYLETVVDQRAPAAPAPVEAGPSAAQALLGAGSAPSAGPVPGRGGRCGGPV